LGELFGPRFLKAITRPITAFVVVFRPAIRINSKRYLQRALPDQSEPTLIDVFRHCEHFTQATIDAIWEWRFAALSPDRNVLMTTDLRRRLYAGKGGVLLSAHFGALEYARARFSADERLKIRAVMFHGNSRVYRGFLDSVNPAAARDVIHVDSFSPATIIQLRDFVSSGGYVALLADRMPPTGTESRKLACRLFGSPINLPYGPFLLAQLLRSEILTFFAVKPEGLELKFYWKDITPDWSVPADTSERIESLASRYIRELESLCKEHPYYWFNFFNYFKDGKSGG
jgi:predicted LPLAT superfamily acyltransferase